MQIFDIIFVIALFVGATAIVQIGNEGLPGEKAHINAKGLFQFSRPAKGLPATCPTSENTKVTEKTSNSTSVETIISEDKGCTTTVNRFSADTSRNTSSVVTSGSKIIKTTSYVRILITETNTTSVVDVEPTTDTSTTETVATTEVTPSKTTQTTLTTPSTSTTAPLRKGIACVFVADAYNFGKDIARYTQERYLIGNMSDYFFKSTVESKAAITKYGYVKSFTIMAAINALKDMHEDFVRDIDTDPEDISTPPFNTAEAIQRINRFDRVKGRANSLIFISAQKDTENLPKLEPKSKEWKRIIAVGFDGTDLTNVIDKDRGAAVSVPYNFSEDDVKKVIDALLEGF
ncbi:hypothetical protein Y032_0470g2030 [Ancylostoma ceylanicum]|uniref:VWFA domain-containing protein n=1 Tax=Ancylostoma ceylanicum TaxID=53326 RepID=A0A016WY25_9BILA|nr:hypothetical protein Y032_0470g2030 [Ancylostoma ceylanicum]